MSYFLTTLLLTKNTPTIISGDEAKHMLLSRRMRVGEQVEIQDPTHRRYICEIININKKTVELLPREQITPPTEYKTKITLCQALVATQALDTIIQKSTELGAHTLTIFKADHSPSSLEKSKLSRWQKIAQEAAKQCGRTVPTQVTLSTLENILSDATKHNSSVLNQTAQKTIADIAKELKTQSAYSVIIGPEGGWSTAELTTFSKAGIGSLLLSKYTLRAETATICALSQLNLFIS